MIVSLRFPQSGIARWCLLLVFLLAAADLRAEDLNIEAQLIWGTNSEKMPEPALPECGQAMAEKFRKVFKWKHYYLVNKQNTIIPSRSTKQITLSKQCTIEITELAGPKVEVTLIGDQKRVNKTVKPLSKGECFVIAGEDKNETAWFVVIT